MKKNEAHKITVQFESSEVAPSLSELVTELHLVHIREALEDYFPSERRALLSQLREELCL